MRSLSIHRARSQQASWPAWFKLLIALAGNALACLIAGGLILGALEIGRMIGGGA